jgi:tetratricopeptide (TPR) repeat protein
MSLSDQSHCAPIPSSRRTILFLLLPLLLALAVHSPSLLHGLIGWDDPTTVSANPLLGKPSLPRLLKHFTSYYHYDYYPVFYLSLWPERLLWEDNPFGPHLSNLLLHSLNAALVYALALELLPKKNPAIAAIVAAAWAVHPVTVEPVAWATGRKVLLAAFFSLLSLWAYIRVERGKGTSAFRRAAAALLFLLSCWSNVAAAAAAPIFGAYEYAGGRRRFGGACRRALPFLLIGMLSLALKLYGRRDHPEAPPEILWTGAHWLPTALAVFGRNLASLFFPLRLSPRYASVTASFPWPSAFWFGLSAGLLVLAGLRRFRRDPPRLFALLWFVLALAPTYGLLRHHIFQADRFLYFPAIGLFLLGGSALPLLAGRLRSRAAIALIGLLSFEAILAVRQTLFWRDDVILWSRAIRIDPENALALNYRGTALLGRGRVEEAIGDFRRAIALKPWIADAHRNLGLALRQAGGISGAIASLRRAIAVRPALADSHFRLAEILAEKGDPEEALAEYSESIRLDPHKAEYRGGIAYLRELRGDFAGAEKLYREAAREFPESDPLRNLLGINLFQQGRFREAIEAYREALSLNPRFAEAWSNLGNVYARMGDREEAIRSYRRALELKPDFASALGNLGAVLAESGRWDEAEESLSRAREISPSSPAIAYHLGTLRFRRGHLAEAEAAFRAALRLDPAFSQARVSLSAVLRAQGREEEENTGKTGR